MPARARRLITAGLMAASAAVLAACGAAPRTSPVTSGTPTASGVPTPSPTPQLVGTTRTVLSPLGLRIHSAPALGSANVVGNFGQGATFTVLDFQSGGGGWLKVQGRSKVGWIVADPTLTAPGTFNQYGSADGVAALYPQSWGFQQESYGVIFLPQQGTQNILLESAPTLEVVRISGTARLHAVGVGNRRRVRVHRHARRVREERVVHRCDADGTAGAATPALRRDPHQVRRDARDADRVQLSEQRAARRVRGPVQLAHVPVPTLRGTGRADTDTGSLAGQSTCVPVLWFTPGTKLLLTTALLAMLIPPAATSRIAM